MMNLIRFPDLVYVIPLLELSSSTSQPHEYCPCTGVAEVYNSNAGWDNRHLQRVWICFADAYLVQTLSQHLMRRNTAKEYGSVCPDDVNATFLLMMHWCPSTRQYQAEVWIYI